MVVRYMMVLDNIGRNAHNQALYIKILKVYDITAPEVHLCFL